jgi:hypothetical protein
MPVTPAVSCCSNQVFSCSGRASVLGNISDIEEKRGAKVDLGQGML